jgi:NitT/TauT family transport system ATP-binding protein
VGVQVTTGGAFIELREVSKAYGSRNNETQVVHDCSLNVDPGKLTVMIGPSGCGKSTLARLIAGFERPSSGKVLCDGKPVVGPSKDRLVLFQETALYPWMTTLQNVLYGPNARMEPKAPSLRAARELIERVGLEPFQGKYPTQLSGGMQRRVELARALINEPRLMILDEPFRGLDAMTKALMQEYFSALFQETRSTVLFVTTDIDEAIFLADRLIIMTNVPTRVCAVIDVTTPRPRRLADVFESDAANDVKMQALSLLHKEAMRSFGAGGKASADFVDAYAKRIGRTEIAQR